MQTEIEVSAIIIVLALMFGAGWWLGGESARTHYAQLQAKQAEDLAKSYQTQVEDFKRRQDDLAKENSALKNAVSAYPTIPVRLCPSTPALPATAPRIKVVHSPAGMGAGKPVQVPSQPAADYGPFVFGLADRLDQLSAKCRAL